MGWVVLALIGVAIAGLLVALGVPRLVWTSIAAALVLAATGYAVQGSPSLPAHPATPQTEAIQIQPDEIELRDAMFGAYHNGTPYLAAADALMRAGDPRSAANASLGGVKNFPNNAALWTELGSTIAASDAGTVSPAARFAFDRAMRLAPGHPAPYYFLGLAYVGAGNAPAARALWIEALRLTPANAPYRDKIAERLRLLDQFMQMSAGAPPPR